MVHRLNIGILGLLLLGSLGLETLRADTGQDAWLRYAPLQRGTLRKYESMPASLIVLGDSAVLRSAQGEMMRGVKGMTGITLRAGKSGRERAIILGTFATIHVAAPGLAPPSPLGADGFWLVTAKVSGFDCLIVTSLTERGVLYGAFALLSKVVRGENIDPLNEEQQPYAPIRWVDQWDNSSGTIERG